MLRIYNTMTHQKEELQPMEDGKVRMYVCGITVYDYCHIGHARSSVVFDTIRRYLSQAGFDTTFVKNFTDIDDKIIKRANESGTPWTDVTEEFIKAHDEDMGALFVLTPDHTPKATDYIDDMIRYCETLIEKGHAYAKNGDVYFRVKSFNGYGKLSHRNIDEMLSGARVAVNEEKESPLDFALWKSAKPNEPSWDSPWGKGRPGWHIECSVMSERLLGLPFDIHGGGADLVFPHHENEIAQSEAYAGGTFVKYWMHNGFVNINQEKMSKSLGNFFTIREVLKEFHPEVLRFFLLSTHYRSALDFSYQQLLDAEQAMERLYTLLDETAHFVPGKKGENVLDACAEIKAAFDEKFFTAMDDDFNTPVAMAAMFEAVRGLNTILASRPDKDTFDVFRATLTDIVDTLQKVLGIANYTPAEWYRQNLMIETDVLEAAIEARNAARKGKNFEEADRIRNELSEKGVELIDTPAGTRFRTRRLHAASDLDA